MKVEPCASVVDMGTWYSANIVWEEASGSCRLVVQM